MCYIDMGIAEALIGLQQKENLQRADKFQQVAVAKAGHQRSLSGQGFHFIRQVGRTLSAVGQRLERAGVPQPSPN